VDDLDINLYSKNLKENGYHIFNNFFSSSYVDTLKKEIIYLQSQYADKRIKTPIKLIGLPFLGGGISDTFLELLVSDKIHHLAKSIIGEDYLYSVFQSNTLLNNLGSEEWFHIDHPYQLLNNKLNKEVMESMVNNNILFSFQIIILLDDFKEDNGSTMFIPKSHKDNVHLNINTKNKKKFIAKKGSIILYNGNLLHSSGINKTNNSRTILIIQFVPKFIRPQEDISDYLNLFKGKDKKIKDLLGANLPWKQKNITFNNKMEEIKFRFFNKIIQLIYKLRKFFN